MHLNVSLFLKFWGFSPQTQLYFYTEIIIFKHKVGPTLSLVKES